MDTSRKIALVVGARPNFMKAAPLIKQLQKYPNWFSGILIHTGQHYDHNLSKLFFGQLDMAKPDIYLGIGSDSHARQTARIMISLEGVLLDYTPDLVIVFGDVNSTIAAALVTSKLGIKLAHVEAGLRSFDMSMPEEINRIVTDRLSNFLFTTEASARANLSNEGTNPDDIFFVGNIMIDTLISNLEKAKKTQILGKLGVKSHEYSLLTLHRPSSVDNKKTLEIILAAIQEISHSIPVIFPCHPRTKERLTRYSIAGEIDSAADPSFKVIEPLGYLDFLNLQSRAKFVLTDSGGIQEETTYLGVPCLTLRENTERPVTVEVGTNTIVGLNRQRIIEEAKKILSGEGKKGKIPNMWDGRTAQRIVSILKDVLSV